MIDDDCSNDDNYMSIGSKIGGGSTSSSSSSNSSNRASSSSSSSSSSSNTYEDRSFIDEIQSDEDFDMLDPDGSVMWEYRRAIQIQLQQDIIEYSKSNRKNFIFELLAENQWWIWSHHAKMLCKRLKIIFFEPEYYRDIYVWLPDVMYGTFYDPIRLSCPTC